MKWHKGGVIVNAGSIQGKEEFGESVVYEFFEIEDELTNCSGDFSRVIPPENVYDGPLKNGVISVRIDLKGTQGRPRYPRWWS